MRGSGAWKVLPLLVAAAWVVSACGDGGPEGPGTIEATVSGSTPLGAVVVEISGSGIQGVSESGDTRLFSIASGPSSRRLVLVRGAAGSLNFAVQVSDIGTAPPAAVVLSAVDAQNLPVALLGEVRVRFD